MADVDSLRYAVFGVAASIFASMHRRAQIAEEINVAAACDVNAEDGKQHAAEIGCAFYEDYRVMLAEAKPEVASESLDLPDTSGAHLAVCRDLKAAIREGRAPRSDGREGRMSLELANAITLSSYAGGPVTLPLDRAAYDELLADLQAGKK